MDQSGRKSPESIILLKRANTLQVGRLKHIRISTGIPAIPGDVPLFMLEINDITNRHMKELMLHILRVHHHSLGLIEIGNDFPNQPLRCIYQLIFYLF